MYTANIGFNENGQESCAVVVDKNNVVQASIRFIDTPYGKDGHKARSLALPTMQYMADLMNKGD